MKVRFESLFREKCEQCGKPAKWKIYKDEDIDSYVAKPWQEHYYCDKCVKEK